MDIETKDADSQFLGDLHAEIQASRDAVAAAPSDGTAAKHWHLGALLYQRFCHTEDLPDIHEAIQVKRRSIQATPQDHWRPEDLMTFVDVLYDLYTHGAYVDFLEEAIHWARITLSLVVNNPMESECLNNVAFFLFERYRVEALMGAGLRGRNPNDQARRRDAGASDDYSYITRLDDVKEAVQLVERSVKLASDGMGRAQRSRRLSDLGVYKFELYRLSEPPQHFEEAIAAFRQAIEISDDDPLTARITGFLASAILTGCNNSEPTADIEEAINLARYAVNAEGSGSGELLLLSRCWGARWKKTKDPKDLEEAMEYSANACNASDGGMLSKFNSCQDLSDQHFALFLETPDREHLMKSLHYGLQAAKAMSWHHQSDRNLGNFRNIFIDQWTHLTDSWPSDQLRSFLEGQASAPDARAALIDCLRRQCDRLFIGHKRGYDLVGRKTGYDVEFKDIFNLLGWIIEIMPHDTDKLSLATALLYDFRYTGATNQLNSAVDILDGLLNASPGLDGDNRGYCLVLRCRARLYEYRITEEPKSLGYAIQSLYLLLRDCQDASVRSKALYTLASSQYLKYCKSHTLDDLNTAIRTLEDAKDQCPPGNPEQASIYSKASYCLLQRYRDIGSAEDLEKAIQLGWQAVESEPAEHVRSALVLERQAICLYTRYLAGGNVEDLYQAIEVMHAEEDVRMPAFGCDYWITLSCLRCERFIISGSVADLKEAIEQKASGMSVGDRKDVDFGYTLSYVLGLSYGDNVERLRKGLEDQAAEARRKSNLALALINRYNCTHMILQNGEHGVPLAKNSHRGSWGALEITDAVEAERCARAALDATAEDHPDRAWYMCCLSLALVTLQAATGKVEDLVEAVTLSGQAVKAVALDHPGRSFYLTVLAVGLNHRFNRAKRFADLCEAVDLGTEALLSAGGGSPANLWVQYFCLLNLSSFLASKYLKQGFADDLEKAREYHTSYSQTFYLICNDRSCLAMFLDPGAGLYAMHRGSNATGCQAPRTLIQNASLAIPVDFVGLDTRLSNLADMYSNLEGTSHQEISQRMIQMSVAATPVGHPQRAHRLRLWGSHVARDVISEYSPAALGNEDWRSDLDLAIGLIQDSIESSPDVTPFSALYLLGDLYDMKTCCLPQAAGTIKMALAVHQECVGIAQPGHPARAACLGWLAASKMRSSDMFSKIQDLADVLTLRKEIVDLTSSNDAVRGQIVQDLGSAYLANFEASRDIEQLNEAIRLFHESLDICRDKKALSGVLGCLGYAYLQTFKMTESSSDFQKAIRTLGRSLKLMPSDHPGKGYRLIDVSRCYLVGSQMTNTVSYLEQAIKFAQHAVDMIPWQEPDHSVALETLGDCYVQKHRITKLRAELASAIPPYRESFYLSQGWDPRSAMTYGRKLLYIHLQMGNWPSAGLVSDRLVELIRACAPRFLDPGEILDSLSHLSGLASLAASIAMHLAPDSPDQALELLEQGRGVMLDYLSDLRRSRLNSGGVGQKSDPDGRRFLALRLKLDPDGGYPRLGSSFDSQRRTSPHTKFAGRLEASKHLEKLLAQRRSTLHRRTIHNSLQYSHKFGYIVVINTSAQRCDALLSGKGGTRMVHLATLSQESIEQRVLEGHRGSLKVLEWLWDTIANPVLTALGILGPPTDNTWPHVWWVMTGALSRFPIHAAGRHTEGTGNSVLDRVMSSYGVSVGTILDRLGERHPKPPSPNAVIVAMEHTPSTTRLRFAEREADTVQKVCQSMSLNTIRSERRSTAIRTHLKDCRIFHFAGHGYTDKRDPLNSHLRLEDWQKDPLTVADLVRMNLAEKPPFLAFLSACGTSRITDTSYLDEGIHLVSACQIAGFRHVIGTLWEVSDATCVHVAKTVYGQLQQGGMTDQSVCQGLHIASRNLRDQWVRAQAYGSMTKTRPAANDSKERSVILGRASQRPRDSAAMRVSRKVIGCDEDELGPALWAPYVHFGV